jgi:hypothetical protein
MGLGHGPVQEKLRRRVKRAAGHRMLRTRFARVDISYPVLDGPTVTVDATVHAQCCSGRYSEQLRSPAAESKIKTYPGRAAHFSSRANTAYSPSPRGIASGASHRSHVIDTSWLGKLAIISVSASSIASASSSRISPSNIARARISWSFHRHNILRTPHPMHSKSATCIPKRTLARRSFAFIVRPRWNYVNTLLTLVNDPIRNRASLTSSWINIAANICAAVHAFPGAGSAHGSVADLLSSPFMLIYKALGIRVRQFAFARFEIVMPRNMLTLLPLRFSYHHYRPRLKSRSGPRAGSAYLHARLAAEYPSCLLRFRHRNGFAPHGLCQKPLCLQQLSPRFQTRPPGRRPHVAKAACRPFIGV